MQIKPLTFQLGLLSALTLLAMPNHAAHLSIGDKASEWGELKLSGFLRAKYQDKSWSSNDHKLSFDAAKINLDYQSKYGFGHIEYRCYQFSELCDFSTLVDAYVGYHLNPTDHITVGVQSIPFGPSRFWESNYYGGINSQFGLEDVHNLGLNYHLKPFSDTTVDLAFFPSDAGNYDGSSQDASRYTTNFVKPNDHAMTHLNEKNMWVARIQQQLQLSDNNLLSTAIGASYWHSDIENKTNGQDGDRNAWLLFSNIGYGNFALTLTGGQNTVENKDPVLNNVSLMGSFDDHYAVANKGTFYTADVRYSFKEVAKIGTITPYAMYSSYDKSHTGFKTSSRHILGVAVDHQDLTFVAEYILGKNDFLIGGSEQSYGSGDLDAKTNKLLNLQVIYNF